MLRLILLQASKSLKLSCKASWYRLVYHCKSKKFHGDTLDDASRAFAEAKDLLTESCEKTAFLLDLLSKGNKYKMNKVLIDSLEMWSIAENIVKSLPPPFLLVKHWVKVKYWISFLCHVNLLYLYHYCQCCTRLNINS